jgi:hypothetical protein
MMPELKLSLKIRKRPRQSFKVTAWLRVLPAAGDCETFPDGEGDRFPSSTSNTTESDAIISLKARRYSIFLWIWKIPDKAG